MLPQASASAHHTHEYPQQGPVEGTAASRLLVNLAARLARGDGAATDDFWSRVERMGTPLVEPDTGSAGHSLVTFVARGGDEVGGIRLDTNLDALLVADKYVSPEALGQMMQLDGSDVWYRSFRLRNEVRAPYHFVSPGNRGHYLLATNRHMRDVLRARGYVLRYEEFNGVHSELSWQDGLAEGLVHLLARDIP